MLFGLRWQSEVEGTAGCSNGIRTSRGCLGRCSELQNSIVQFYTYGRMTNYWNMLGGGVQGCRTPLLTSTLMTYWHLLEVLGIQRHKMYTGLGTIDTKEIRNVERRQGVSTERKREQWEWLDSMNKKCTVNRNFMGDRCSTWGAGGWQMESKRRHHTHSLACCCCSCL